MKSVYKSVRVAGIATLGVAGIATQERFGMLPESVLFDARVSHAAARVYACLARYCLPGKPVTIGIRRVAGLIGASTSTVRMAIGDLTAAGHLQLNESGGRRGSYWLTSSRFGRRAWRGESAGEVVEMYADGGVLQKRIVKSRAG